MAIAYQQFMNEYEKLDHMRVISPDFNNNKNDKIYYIPHHGIWQKSDGNVKLRVVFNASRATTSDYSLNDLLYVGKKLQNNIFRVL